LDDQLKRGACHLVYPLPGFALAAFRLALVVVVLGAVLDLILFDVLNWQFGNLCRRPAVPFC
jgi:hypothetical protein